MTIVWRVSYTNAASGEKSERLTISLHPGAWTTATMSRDALSQLGGWGWDLAGWPRHKLARNAHVQYWLYACGIIATRVYPSRTSAPSESTTLCTHAWNCTSLRRLIGVTSKSVSVPFPSYRPSTTVLPGAWSLKCTAQLSHGHEGKSTMAVGSISSPRSLPPSQVLDNLPRYGC